MKISYLLSAALFVGLNTTALAHSGVQHQPAAEQVASKSMKVLNDTKSKVRIHTGSGFVTLNKGSKTSFSCKVGKKVSLAEKGKKKKTLFKITSSMCGKTIELSEYM